MGATRKAAKGVKPDTPNLDKMVESADESQAIGAFIDWLVQDDVVLMRWQTVPHERPCTNYKKPSHRETLEGMVALEAEFRQGDPLPLLEDRHPTSCTCDGTGVISWTEEGWSRVMRHGGDEGIRRLLAPYYDIDYDEMNRERDLVLAWVREQNGTT